jgi:hypothetical protein
MMSWDSHEFRDPDRLVALSVLAAQLMNIKNPAWASVVLQGLSRDLHALQDNAPITFYPPYPLDQLLPKSSILRLSRSAVDTLLSLARRMAFDYSRVEEDRAILLEALAVGEETGITLFLDPYYAHMWPGLDAAEIATIAAVHGQKQILHESAANATAVARRWTAMANQHRFASVHGTRPRVPPATGGGYSMARGKFRGLFVAPARSKVSKMRLSRSTHVSYWGHSDDVPVTNTVTGSTMMSGDQPWIPQRPQLRTVLSQEAFYDHPVSHQIACAAVGPLPDSKGNQGNDAVPVAGHYPMERKARPMGSFFREHPNVTYISLSVPNNDTIWQMLKGYSNQVMYMKSMNAPAISDTISNVVKAHIAVDLQGYTTNTRLGHLVQHPGKVQISMIAQAYPLITDFIDWFVSDTLIAPPDSIARTFQEGIVYFPVYATKFISDGILGLRSSERIPRRVLDLFPMQEFTRCQRKNESNDTGPGMPATCKYLQQVSAERGSWGDQPERHHTCIRDLRSSFDFIFAAFHSPVKYESTSFNSWANILMRSPRSAFVIMAADEELSKTNIALVKMMNESTSTIPGINSSSDEALADDLTSVSAIARLQAELSARGVHPARVITQASVPLSVHSIRASGMDLSLDAFAYGAHSTTLDLLSASIPTLTMRGDTCSVRVASSFMSSTLPSFSVDSTTQYEDSATLLSTTRRKVVYGAKLVLRRAMNESVSRQLARWNITQGQDPGSVLPLDMVDSLRQTSTFANMMPFSQAGEDYSTWFRIMAQTTYEIRSMSEVNQ